MSAMVKKTTLTHERLREVLHYEPETGVFTWAVTLSHRGKAGSKAGYFDQGYRSIRIDRVGYRANRLAWFYVHGKWPVGHVDHMSGDKTDDRICNLRDVPPIVNQQNRHGAMRNSTSGVLGVSWRACWKHWRVSVVIDGKQREIGTFKELEDARIASLEARRKHYEGFLL